MITLTTEQAQQIEEALEDIVRVFKFETGTPVEALAAIRAARAQGQAEQEPVARLSIQALLKMYGEEGGDWCKIARAVERHYTAPVRTKDLTDDEIEAIVNSVGAYAVGYW